MCVFNAPKAGFSSIILYNIGNGASVTPQAYSTEYADRFRVSVQKSFLRGKIDLSLSYWIPIHLMSGNSKQWLHSLPLNTYTWSNNQFREDNKIMLRLSYRLNKGATVRKINIEEMGTD